MRAPGMTYMRMPLFTWTTFVASALILFAFPPLTVGLFLLMFDRMFGANFFDVADGWKYNYLGAYILDFRSPRSIYFNFSGIWNFF